MINCCKSKSSLLSLALLLGFTTTVLSANIEQNLNVSAKTNAIGQSSQQKIDKLSNETENLLREYQRFLQQADYQQAYNNELKQRLIEQEEELSKLEQQIAEVQITRLHILPLLREMVESLKQFVQLDLPFEKEARLQSIEKLETLLATSSVSIAEKFRRVMEAWQAENDLSYNIGQYRGDVTQGGEQIAVEFLRIGRSQLYYQTLDGKKSAFWSKPEKKWQLLDGKYNSEIRAGIRVAAKQLPPQLLTLPVDNREVK